MDGYSRHVALTFINCCGRYTVLAHKFARNTEIIKLPTLLEITL